MTIIVLSEPIELDGAPVSELRLRKPSGTALLELGLHVPILTTWAHADRDAQKQGQRVHPNSKVFAAMVAVAGALTGLGTDRAGRLLFIDIDRIVAAGAPLLADALAAEPLPAGRGDHHGQSRPRR